MSKPVIKIIPPTSKHPQPTKNVPILDKTTNIDEELHSLIHIVGCQMHDMGWNSAKSDKFGDDIDKIEEAEDTLVADIKSLIKSTCMSVIGKDGRMTSSKGVLAIESVNKMVAYSNMIKREQRQSLQRKLGEK